MIWCDVTPLFCVPVYLTAVAVVENIDKNPVHFLSHSAYNGFSLKINNQMTSQI